MWYDFFGKAPSFEAREAHRYLNNRLGIFRASGGGLLNHPYDTTFIPSLLSSVTDALIITKIKKYWALHVCDFGLEKDRDYKT